MNNQRVAGIPMETRGVLAQPDALSGGLVVVTSTQNPHPVRQEIAGALGLSEIDRARDRARRSAAASASRSAATRRT